MYNCCEQSPLLQSEWIEVVLEGRDLCLEQDVEALLLNQQELSKLLAL